VIAIDGTPIGDDGPVPAEESKVRDPDAVAKAVAEAYRRGWAEGMADDTARVRAAAVQKLTLI
jgi:hypothetical protein